MPTPLSLDLRERIVEAYLAGKESNAEIAARFSVSVTTVERLSRRSREGRSLEPETPPGRPPKVTGTHREWIAGELERDPYLSSYELAARFRRRFPRCRVHRSTVLRVMHDLGFTFKKKSLRSPA